MDDLLVIIITILFAVIGVLGQRKKKREAANAPQGGGVRQPDFWEMLMGEQDTQHRPSPHIYFDDEPEEEAEEEKKPVFQPSYSFKTTKEGSSDIIEKGILKDNPAKKKVLIEGEEFSLRKAVIYSEIMNRKYT